MAELMAALEGQAHGIPGFISKEDVGTYDQDGTRREVT